MTTASHLTVLDSNNQHLASYWLLMITVNHLYSHRLTPLSCGLRTWPIRLCGCVASWLMTMGDGDPKNDTIIRKVYTSVDGLAQAPEKKRNCGTPVDHQHRGTLSTPSWVHGWSVLLHPTKDLSTSRHQESALLPTPAITTCHETHQKTDFLSRLVELAQGCPNAWLNITIMLPLLAMLNLN